MHACKRCGGSIGQGIPLLPVVRRAAAREALWSRSTTKKRSGSPRFLGVRERLGSLLDRLRA